MSTGLATRSSPPSTFSVQRYASVVWHGDLQKGGGSISTLSGALRDAPYSCGARFDPSGTRTSPEELIAAAHAACFSMALASELEDIGLRPGALSTHATTTLEQGAYPDSWSITEVHLDVSADLPRETLDRFEAAARRAKANCPVSRLLRAKINLVTHLQPPRIAEAG